MNLKAGYPFSLIQNGLVASYPKLERDIKTDILIIGAGVSGALISWELSKRNIQSVVIDGRSVGLGSTCASTSLIQYELDVPLFKLIKLIGKKNAERAYSISYEAVNKLSHLARELGFNAFRKNESVYYAAYPSHADDLEKEYEARKNAGFAVRFYSGKEMLEQTSVPSVAGIISKNAGEADAYLLTHSLLQNGIKKGLLVFDRSPAGRIIHHRKGVEVFTRNGCRIAAGKLIYATGYEAVKMIDKKIVKLKSTFATISESFTGNKPFWVRNRLLWNTANPYLYIRTTSDNRIIVGGRDENFYSPRRRDPLIPLKTRQLKADLRGLFPHLEFIPEFSWTGTFGTTPDGLPYIGSYRKLSNSYFALGFGGNGVTFSLVASEMIADLIEGKKNSDLDLFSFNRIQAAP